MSVGDRILSTLRDVLLMNEKVTQLTARTDQLQQRVADHGERLVRLETIVEMAGGRRTPPGPPQLNPPTAPHG